jgi:hypothetical protein
MRCRGRAHSKRGVSAAQHSTARKPSQHRDHTHTWVEGVALLPPLVALCDEHAVRAQNGEKVHVAGAFCPLIDLKHLPGGVVCQAVLHRAVSWSHDSRTHLLDGLRV